MSYGPNFDELTKRIATYVDRIFKGAKPSDLPVDAGITLSFGHGGKHRFRHPGDILM
jgi:hypothetical protein